MTPTTLVSVVMSTYNGQRYLGASLDSVLSQEGIDFEVVVVDDGSTDTSTEILSEYARRDRRLRVIRQENRGLTRALARGCEEARGRLIARQDDDDTSVTWRLSRLAAVLERHPEVAVASSWVESIGPEDEFLSVTTYPDDVNTATEGVLHRRRSPFHGSVMFRKEDFGAVGGYRPQFYFAQDADLWFRIAERGGFLFVPEVLYRFRITEGAISTRHRDSQVKLYALAEECRSARRSGRSDDDFLAQAAEIRPGMSGGGRTKRGAGAYFLGRTLLRNGDSRARKYLRAYVRERPFDPRGWLGLFQAVLPLRRRSRGQRAPRTGESP